MTLTKRIRQISNPSSASVRGKEGVSLYISTRLAFASSAHGAQKVTPEDATEHDGNGNEWRWTLLAQPRLLIARVEHLIANGAFWSGLVTDTMRARHATKTGRGVAYLVVRTLIQSAGPVAETPPATVDVKRSNR